MITVGIDLAAEPRSTAAVVVNWTAAAVTYADVGLTDPQLVELSRNADKIGIDCPLGWPEPFVEFVLAHRSRRVGPAGHDQEGWRRALTNRTTDRDCATFTKSQLGKAIRPLSVSADLIGHVALRCAVLLSRLADDGRDTDRAGGGHIVEVYPAASLALWGATHRGYKGSGATGIRAEMVRSFQESMPWLDLGEHRDQLVQSDHRLDAFVAALAARAAATNRATKPGNPALAQIEGWIALPICSIEDLRFAPPIRPEPAIST